MHWTGVSRGSARARESEIVSQPAHVRDSPLRSEADGRQVRAGVARVCAPTPRRTWSRRGCDGVLLLRASSSRGRDGSSTRGALPARATARRPRWRRHAAPAAARVAPQVRPRPRPAHPRGLRGLNAQSR
eukprot:scaffold958_cov325-Prasinococcus_capsulatus_cf.AAC.5